MSREAEASVETSFAYATPVDQLIRQVRRRHSVKDSWKKKDFSEQGKGNPEMTEMNQNLPTSIAAQIVLKMLKHFIEGNELTISALKRTESE